MSNLIKSSFIVMVLGSATLEAQVIDTGHVIESAVIESAVIESAVIESVPCDRCGGTCGVDLMDVRNFTLRDYRRMFSSGRTPSPSELQGRWHGVNKGLVRLIGYKQFIKEIRPCGSVMIGDNIQVHQVSDQLLRSCGWQPKIDARTGAVERMGKYLVKPPTRRGFFGNGVVLSYRDGGNRRFDPTRVIVDKVVLLDCNHLLGRASVRFGLISIPVGYFMLERVG